MFWMANGAATLISDNEVPSREIRDADDARLHGLRLVGRAAGYMTAPDFLSFLERDGYRTRFGTGAS
jgi:hypothetical protein